MQAPGGQGERRVIEAIIGLSIATFNDVCSSPLHTQHHGDGVFVAVELIANLTCTELDVKRWPSDRGAHASRFISELKHTS